MRLRDMGPRLSMDSIKYHVLADAVLAREGRLSCSFLDAAANIKDGFFRQFGMGAQVAARHSFWVLSLPVTITTQTLFWVGKLPVFCAVRTLFRVQMGPVLRTLYCAPFHIAVLYVAGPRPKKEVQRVTARGVIARVANKLLPWVYPVMQVKCNAVRSASVPTNGKLPIALGAAPRPKPALIWLCLVHVTPEACYFLRRKVEDSRIRISHGMFLLVRKVLGLEPLSVLVARAAACFIGSPIIPQGVR